MLSRLGEQTLLNIGWEIEGHRHCVCSLRLLSLSRLSDRLDGRRE
jgi:hypothetical protein